MAATKLRTARPPAPLRLHRSWPWPPLETHADSCRPHCRRSQHQKPSSGSPATVQLKYTHTLALTFIIVALRPELQSRVPVAPPIVAAPASVPIAGHVTYADAVRRAAPAV